MKNAEYRASGIQFRLSGAKISMQLVQSCNVNVNKSGSHRLRKFEPTEWAVASRQGWSRIAAEPLVIQK